MGVRDLLAAFDACPQPSSYCPNRGGLFEVGIVSSLLAPFQPCHDSELEPNPNGVTGSALASHTLSAVVGKQAGTSFQCVIRHAASCLRGHASCVMVPCRCPAKHSTFSLYAASSRRMRPSQLGTSQTCPKHSHSARWLPCESDRLRRRK